MSTDARAAEIEAQKTDADRAADLTWDEALALAKTDAPKLAAFLRAEKKLAPSLWPSKHARRVRWLRWRWWVADPAVTNTLADGYALTERWARHQADLAAGRIWAERVEAQRTEVEQRRAES